MSMSGLPTANSLFLATHEPPTLAKARPPSISEGKPVLFNTSRHFQGLACRPQRWDTRILHQTLMFPFLGQTLKSFQKQNPTLYLLCYFLILLIKLEL